MPNISLGLHLHLLAYALIHPQLGNTQVRINTQHPHTYGTEKREEISVEGGLRWSKEGDLLGDLREKEGGGCAHRKYCGVRIYSTHTEKKESSMVLWFLLWVAKQKDSIHRDWGSIRKAKAEKELTAR